MDTRRQLQILRARLRFLAASVAIAAAIAFTVTSLAPQVYEARATLIVGQSLSSANPDYNQLLASQRLSATYASLATQRPVLEAVIAQLHLSSTADALANHVHADVSQTTAFLTVVVQDNDPATAAAVANAVAMRIIAASPSVSGQQGDLLAAAAQELAATHAAIDATQADIDRLHAIAKPTDQQLAQLLVLEDRVTSLRSTYATLLASSAATASNAVTLIDPAVAPTSAVSPSRSLMTALAAIVGLLVAGAIVFLFEYFNDSLKRPEDVTETTHLPMLGSIGRMKGGRNHGELERLVTMFSPRSQVAEAYRSLRTNIEFASVDVPLRVLLVASAIPGEGKTVTASNLAVVFAQAGRRVLLVDADLRRPGIDAIFKAPNSTGLTTLLLNDEMRHEGVTQATEQANLRILTTGPLPPNPAEILGSRRMVAVLKRLSEAYDLTILDGPPLDAVADSAVLSARVDGTLLVVDAVHSRRQSVVRAAQALQRAGAQVIGVALNRFGPEVDRGYLAYGAEAGGPLDRASTTKAS